MYNLFNLNEIKPTGWLLEQLKLQASGQAGNLDKIWPVSNVAVSDFEEKLLIPYGCAKLRLTEMPKVEKR